MKIGIFSALVLSPYLSAELSIWCRLAQAFFKDLQINQSVFLRF